MKYLFVLCALFICMYSNAQNDNGKKQTPSKKVLRIMPFGDSLTENSEPGYRGFLYKLLTESGFEFDFVGVRSSVPSNGGDPDHSGFSGYVIGPDASVADAWSDALYNGNLYYHLNNGFAVMTTQPDVILLMAGTNDFGNNREESYNPVLVGAIRLEALLDKIYSISPNVIVLVASITPTAWDMEGYGKKFNSDLPGIVQREQEKGYKCFFVDVRGEHKWDEKRDILEDKVHLTAEGYEKIAYSFFNSLLPILKKQTVYP